MATLYFQPAAIELPEVGDTFDVAIKYRESLLRMRGFWVYVIFDTSILYYDSTVSVIQENVGFSDTRFDNISVNDPRSGVLISSGKTPISNTAFDPLISGTDLTLLTIRFEVKQREATSLNISTGRTTESQIYLSSGLHILEPAVESATLTVDGLSMPPPPPVEPPTPEPPVEPPTPMVSALKPFSYQGNPISLTVKIHDADVTADLAAIDDIAKNVDYPQLTEFRIGEATFTLRDIHGDFSPNNPSNFFTRHGGHRTGRHSPVEIEAGFFVDGTQHTETIFKGTILRIVQDVKPATIKVICADGVGGLRSDAITDFGIGRHFMLVADLQRSGENGFYPIMDAVMPASHGSVTLARHTGETLQPVQRLETEGTLNPKNFVIDANGVRTEGGLIANRGVGYPQIRMKSPYRYRHIQDIITDILNHAGITRSEIAIPERDVDPHFSRNGRINYDLIGNIGSSNPVTWNGYVTDFLYDAANQKWFFLYNKHRNNPNGFSQVIVYDVATRTYTQLHDFTSETTEVWKFTKHGNSIYILSTTGGNYDANESSSENKIIKVDIGTDPPTETVFVAHTDRRQPQLSHYYAGVGSVHHKPDSRRQLIYRQNALYYAFIDRGNNKFGVAKATAANTTTAIITINLDTYQNHAGLAFDINASGVLHGAATFVSGSRSQILAFRKTL